MNTSISIRFCFFKSLVAKSRLRAYSFFLLIITVSPQFLFSQDGHYWTEQYGNKSMLLSGVVIGNVSDLGAVYYNPARLGLIEKPAFLLNAKLFQLTIIKFEDGLGENIDLSKSNFGDGPSLIAGSFDLKIINNHRFSYSILTRNSFDFDSFFRTEEKGEIIENIPGDEAFVGQVELDSKINDLWLGITWAYKINKNSSLGATMFASYLTNEKFFDMRLQALSIDNNSVAIFNNSRKINYKSYGLLWKIGYAVDFSKMVSFGITLTTPKVNLGGRGDFVTQEFLTGIDTTGDGINDDIFIANAQDGLKVKSKDPWSIGIGLGLNFGGLSISISGEWFSAISKYTIIETQPFSGQSTGQTITNSLTDDLNSVINYGLGAEYSFNNSFSIYLSYATDFSAVPDRINRFLSLDTETSNSTFKANIYHMGGGAVFNFKKMEFTIGSNFSFSKEIAPRVLTIPSEGGGSETVNTTSVIKVKQWRFIVGFSLPFAKEEKNKIE